MHPHEGDWRAWLDDEVPPLVRQQLDRHLTECGECQQQVEALHGARELTTALLAELDVPAPTRSVESVLVRVERRASRRWVLIAAAIAAIVVTTASATIQGVIFRRLTAVLREAHVWPSPPVVASSAVAPDTTEPNSVSTVASDSLEIDFRGPQQAGAGLTIRLGEGPDVTISATSAVVYAIGSDRITVTSVNGATNFAIVLPRLSPRVVVRIAGTVVFAKAGAAITTVANPDSTGTYGLSMHQPERNFK